jgi:3-oxoacyl-[acyl-carrier protein] reductase
MNDMVALVTGGARGIGAAVCDGFLAGGARVAFTDIDEEAGRAREAELGGRTKALFVKADSADAADAERMVAETVAAFGRLDVLVNNAGVTRDALAAKMTEADFDAVMRGHLKGSWLCARAAYKPMRAQGGGRIINTSSVSALGNVGQSNYAAAKAGVIGLTKTLALEWARFGIRVNAVMPGFIETRMTATLPEKVRAMLVDKIPLGRFGKPEELARVHVFLAGPGGDYITGQVFCADGGLTAGF